MAGTQLGAVPSIVQGIDLQRVYGTGDETVVAIDLVSIDIRPGEFVAIEGPSGCGKSTLLHLLGGLDQPTTGTVKFDGRDLWLLDDDARSRLRRDHLGIVLPLVDLLGTLTAWENVAISLLLAGRRLNEGKDRAAELLRLVGLSGRMNTTASRLSTGESQRVALARAMFNRPRLLIADEPTSFLDSVRSDEILTLLRQLADDGQAIVMASHEPRAAAYADRSIRLLDGRIVA